MDQRQDKNYSQLGPSRLCSRPEQNDFYITDSQYITVDKASSVLVTLEFTSSNFPMLTLAHREKTKTPNRSFSTSNTLDQIQYEPLVTAI